MTAPEPAWRCARRELLTRADSMASEPIKLRGFLELRNPPGAIRVSTCRYLVHADSTETVALAVSGVGLVLLMLVVTREEATRSVPCAGSLGLAELARGARRLGAASDV